MAPAIFAWGAQGRQEVKMKVARLLGVILVLGVGSTVRADDVFNACSND